LVEEMEIVKDSTPVLHVSMMLTAREIITVLTTFVCIAPEIDSIDSINGQIHD